MHTWLGVSHLSTYKDRWVWRKTEFAGGDGSRGKPGEFPGSPLCSHKTSLVETLQQMENYAVYWERQGHSLMPNLAGANHPLDSPAFTFTCTNSTHPLIDLLKRSHSQHRMPFPVPFVQWSWARVAGGTGHFLHPIPFFSAPNMERWC